VSPSPVAGLPLPSRTSVRIAQAGGLHAVVTGVVPGAAWELAGHQVAARAVWATFVAAENRKGKGNAATSLLIDGAPTPLRPGVAYKSVTASLGGDKVSILILAPEAVHTAESLLAESLEATATHRVFVYRADAVGVDGVPVGFLGVLRALVPLPFAPEWAAPLWTATYGRLLEPVAQCAGTLAGVRFASVAVERWAPHLRACLR
jgi:hypothetical protein